MMILEPMLYGLIPVSISLLIIVAIHRYAEIDWDDAVTMFFLGTLLLGACSLVLAGLGLTTMGILGVL